MEGTDTEGITTGETNVEDLVPVAAIAFIGIPCETEEALEKILEKEADTQTLIIVIVEEQLPLTFPLS